MPAHLRTCPRCARHVRAADRCPFCAAPTLTVAAAVAVAAASIAVAACGGAEQTGTDGGASAHDASASGDGSADDAGLDATGFDVLVPADAQPDVMVVPVYGAPPVATSPRLRIK